MEFVKIIGNHQTQRQQHPKKQKQLFIFSNAIRSFDHQMSAFVIYIYMCPACNVHSKSTKRRSRKGWKIVFDETYTSAKKLKKARRSTYFAKRNKENTDVNHTAMWSPIVQQKSKTLKEQDSMIRTMWSELNKNG